MYPSDVGAWAMLLAAVREADDTWEFVGEEELLEDFDDPDRDFEVGSRAVFDGDTMVAYGELLSRSAADPVHDMRYDGGVHPAYRRRGIGSQLLDWAESAALQLHGRRHGGRPLSLSGSCAADDTGAVTLFQSRGYRPVRWFHGMTRALSSPLTDVPVPEGVQLRDWSSELTEMARVVRNDAFRDHWGSTERSAEAWAHFMSTAAFRPRLSFLAVAGGVPVGFIIGHEYERDPRAAGRDLYISAVGTLRAHRGRGVATSLTARALREATVDGFATASLDVDADSPTGALALYVRLGFAVEHTSVQLMKPLLKAEGDR